MFYIAHIQVSVAVAVIVSGGLQLAKRDAANDAASQVTTRRLFHMPFGSCTHAFRWVAVRWVTFSRVMTRRVVVRQVWLLIVSGGPQSTETTV